MTTEDSTGSDRDADVFADAEENTPIVASNEEKEPNDEMEGTKNDSRLDDDSSSGDDEDESEKIKREQRLALNRESARMRRKRNRDLMGELENKVVQLTRRCQMIEDKNKAQATYIAKLEAELVQANVNLAAASSDLRQLHQLPLSTLAAVGPLEQERLRALMELVQRDAALNSPPVAPLPPQDPQIARQLIQLELSARTQPLQWPEELPSLRGVGGGFDASFLNAGRGAPGARPDQAALFAMTSQVDPALLAAYARNNGANFFVPEPPLKKGKPRRPK